MFLADRLEEHRRGVQHGLIDAPDFPLAERLVQLVFADLGAVQGADLGVVRVVEGFEILHRQWNQRMQNSRMVRPWVTNSALGA